MSVERLDDNQAVLAPDRVSSRTLAFGLLLLLSGFCGISYEILYARILSNFIGDQFAVSASVLLTFLLGIGIGTLHAHRLRPFLWMIEGGVGACAVTFALGVPRFGAWLYSGPGFQGGMAASVATCFLLLGIPAFLIGCSLPLFGDYLGRLRPGPAFAKAYSVYNVGAGLTVLVVEFCLLRLLGIQKTVLTMAALNGLIATSLFFAFRDLRGTPGRARRQSPAGAADLSEWNDVRAGIVTPLEPRAEGRAGGGGPRAEAAVEPPRGNDGTVGAGTPLEPRGEWRAGALAAPALGPRAEGRAALHSGSARSPRVDGVPPRSHLAALAIASVASAVFQLLMIKLSECFIGPFRETFALILALILVGIAVGSAVVERTKLDFPRLLMLCLAGLALLTAGFDPITRAYAALYPAAAGNHALLVLLKLATLTLLMGAPAIGFGATIPALLRPEADVARDSGRLLFISSTANAFGFLLMAFVLHRYLDYGVLVVVVAALAVLSLLVYAGFRGRQAVAAMSLLVAVFALERSRWDENLLYLGHTSFRSGAELRASRRQMHFAERFKGYQDVFSLNRTGKDLQFFINGFISMSLKAPTERVVGAFSALFAPRTDRALVLGVGSGASAGTVGLLFDRTDAVEINPVVIENLYRMAPYNFDILSRPQIHIIVDDGIRFTRASRDRYSLILNTVTTPLYFSSSKLYTRDFLETVRERLTPDGVYVTFVDGRVGERGLDIILKTLSGSFRQCWIGAIRSSYFLLICSQQEIAVRSPRLIAENTILADYFYKGHGLRPDWLVYGLMHTHALDLIADQDVPINTLDDPSLEFEIAGLGQSGIREFKKRLTAAMTLEDVARPLRPVMDFRPVDLALHTELLVGFSSILERWLEQAPKEVGGFQARYDRAKLEYFASFASAAGTAEAHHQYGVQLVEQEKDLEAIAEFELALSIDPSCDDCHLDMGTAYEEIGEYEIALDQYGKERARDPEDERVAFRMGRTYFRMKRYEEALRSLNDAAAYDEQDAEPLYYRGRVLEAMGRMTEARATYQSALKLEVDYEEARAALTRLRSAGG